MAFETYAEQWRAAQVHRATTVAQVETHLRRHVYPTFGGQPLGSIRPSEVQAWVRSLERDLAPSTIGVVYSFVAGVFRAAVRDRITLTPCADVRLPKPEPKRVEPLATERVEALIAAMPERYRALVVLAAGTGMRQGEAYPLMLEHSFERTASQLRGGVALGSGATGRPGRARSTHQPTATPRGWCRSTLPDRVDAPARPLTARGRTTRGTPHGHQASSHHHPAGPKPGRPRPRPRAQPVPCRRHVAGRLPFVRPRPVEGRNQAKVERKAARSSCPVCVEVA